MKKILVSLLLCLVFGFSQKTYAIENIYSLDDVKTPSTQQTTAPETSDNNLVLTAEVTFDWLDISTAQREENIEKYKNLLFENNSSKIYFTKEEFKKEFANYYKDREYKLHYMLTNNGVTEDEDAKYCAFFSKGNTLLIYAIQYKKNPTNAFYYSGFGRLYYTDVMSDEYPNFPYTSMQYNKKGELKSAIYFVSKDIQYMYGPDKEFQGIWYKEKMYDKNGKIQMTRTNW